jgi:prepilin signal peptidase PulO-like enzyme (type II secretory pathway)
LPLKEGLISGLLAFVTFLIIYFISRGGIGMGDCKYTAVTSIYFGYSFWLNSILYTSIISLSVSLILLFVKKIKRETKIPFMPFLVSGWIGNYLKETIFYP